VSAAVQPRWSDAAEVAVLGAILLDAVALLLVADKLRPADFYKPAHQQIFEAMLALSARGDPIDIVTLKNECERLGRNTAFDWLVYLGEITASCPSGAHIERHASIVLECAEVRRLRQVHVEGIAKIDDRATTRDQAYEFSSSRFAEVSVRIGRVGPVPFDRVVQEAFERIEKTSASGKRISGLETGYRDLDTLTAGMHPGQLIIIAARPAMGKTSLALNITQHVALSPDAKPSLFFSFEMPRVELGTRMLAAEARIDQSRMRTNMLTGDDFKSLTAAAERIYNIRVDTIDGDGNTLADIRSHARRMKIERGLGFVVIDYLQLMKGEDRAGRDRGREQEISEISRGLKALAKELEVPIVALSQLNRAAETRPGKDRRPQLSDLRESGAIEQDADVVIFIYRDEVYNRDSDNRGIAEIIVAKQRNGPTDTVRLRFIRELTKFENLSEDDRTHMEAPRAAEPVEPFDPYEADAAE
jgi:replicative DNA helicase